MTVVPQAEVPIQKEADIVLARRAVREAASRLGFGATDTTRIVTAASELARNVFRYACPGVMRLHQLDDGDRSGLELQFEDHGPGIANAERGLREGFPTSGGLGLGLRGAKRLMDEMDVRTEMGKGTLVTVRKWRRNVS
jgi:serine/threonine-protein kinase RsbT